MPREARRRFKSWAGVNLGGGQAKTNSEREIQQSAHLPEPCLRAQMAWNWLRPLTRAAGSQEEGKVRVCRRKELELVEENACGQAMHAKRWGRGVTRGMRRPIAAGPSRAQMPG